MDHFQIDSMINLISETQNFTSVAVVAFLEFDKWDNHLGNDPT